MKVYAICIDEDATDVVTNKPTIGAAYFSAEFNHVDTFVKAFGGTFIGYGKLESAFFFIQQDIKREKV
jgi:hypothetical protein